jgi:SagB-type dehydrogenase family enzyme
MNRVRAIRDYHERTQHHQHRFAAAMGYMDWANQPDPYRRYTNAPRHLLPLCAPDGQPRYPALFAPPDAGALPAAAVDGASIGRLFQDSLALSAWKQQRTTRWALRVNPSSGNLHPTEAYLLIGAVPGLCELPTLSHYAVREHALERRAEIPRALWQTITAGLPDAALLVGLTSIPWRESWKYGERAYRYCMQDLGHAIGALGFAAAALGWRTTLLPVPDAELAVLLGIDEQRGPEAEHPDALLVVHREHEPTPAWARSFAIATNDLEALRALQRHGTPAPLSRDHHDWPAIDEAIDATRLLQQPPALFWDRPAATRDPLPRAPDADSRVLFQQRRSAVAMDGRTGSDAESFCSTLQRVVDARSPPLQALPWRGRVHLLLFVHRIAGLVPGCYCLVRGGQDPQWLRSRMRPEFLWERPDGVPASLPLFLLLPIDCREAARTVSCTQAIAADSAFAVAMLAEFAPTLDAIGPWGWRVLHWEAGAIGQLLYLEAEASGLRATGIGCFFDSAVHEVLGIGSEDLRTIYHFTTGGAVEDERLQVLPPYPERS